LTAQRGVPTSADSNAVARAGRDGLSVALLDARNHLLQALAAFGEPVPNAALRLALAAAWYQEHWISRHVQRSRGPACDPAGVRLAGVEPRIGLWLAPAADTAEPATPDSASVRSYLVQTLEITLDLLASAAEDDAALHFYRQALLHEDRLVEALAVLLQRAAPAARAQRAPLWLPAQRVQLGTQEAGWRVHNEQGLLIADVPEFEIDAQAVNWQQFSEFAADGGYDRAPWWSSEGWQWLQAFDATADGSRRAPRHVAQLKNGVLVQRGSLGLVRAAPGQAAMHVSRHEAQAWCCWAGRRLPTEAEWQAAATTAASRGFVWGDVFEWVAGRARAWPGARPSAPGCLDVGPHAESPCGVLRGASFATLPRRRSSSARRFMPAGHDQALMGFRSCSI